MIPFPALELLVIHLILHSECKHGIFFIEEVQHLYEHKYWLVYQSQKQVIFQEGWLMGSNV